MGDRIKVTKKILSTLNEVESLISLKLIEEEPNFTGKITIDVNCNQGGITGVEVYTKRKINMSTLNKNTGN